jgi:hypothetical protein
MSDTSSTCLLRAIARVLALHVEGLGGACVGSGLWRALTAAHASATAVLLASIGAAPYQEACDRTSTL